MMRTICMVLGVACATSVASHAWAAAPAVSRGEVLLDVPFDECMARAKAAFPAEGFAVEQVDNTSYVLARKDIHTAYITCSPAPHDKTWANVFVASSTNDGKVAGSERIALQARMRQPVR